MSIGEAFRFRLAFVKIERQQVEDRPADLVAHEDPEQ